jgi:hypothetical protein
MGARGTAQAGREAAELRMPAAVSKGIRNPRV